MRQLQQRSDIEQSPYPAATAEKDVALLLNEHKDQLYYAAYLLVRDRYLAEDIFQEACIKVLKSLRKGNYAEEGKFVPWVARIVA